MSTVKINIPEGFEIDTFNVQTGEVNFKQIPMSIIEKIKSWDDVLKVNNIKQEDFALSCSELTNDEVAYKQIKLIVKTFN